MNKILPLLFPLLLLLASSYALFAGLSQGYFEFRGVVYTKGSTMYYLDIALLLAFIVGSLFLLFTHKNKKD
jgi:hypothetical protein